VLIVGNSLEASAVRTWVRSTRTALAQHSLTPTPADPNARVRATRAGYAYRVFAVEELATGQTVLVIDGEPVERPSRWSMQVDTHRHISVRDDLALAELLERYPWRFTNHACEPNTRLMGTTLVAVRPIAAGEEITFNYNTTELDLAEPFACRCGHSLCARSIRGFRHLTPEERERLRPLLAGHLLKLLA